MPAKEFVVANKARKQLLKFPPGFRQRFAKALIEIKENPLTGMKLHGEFEGKYKYRIGDYRIVYSFDSKKSLVEILKVEHRQGVYK